MTYPFAKMFLYFDVLTVSSILNLGFLSLFSLPDLMHVFDFTSTGFSLNQQVNKLFYDMYCCMYCSYGTSSSLSI